jgi:hypothetical protein
MHKATVGLFPTASSTPVWGLALQHLANTCGSILICEDLVAWLQQSLANAITHEMATLQARQHARRIVVIYAVSIRLDEAALYKLVRSMHT